MNNIQSIIIIGLLFLLGCSHVNAEQWIYRDPLRPNDVFIIQVDPDSFGFKDVLESAYICPKDHKYICVVGKGIEFYIPRNINKNNLKWIVNGKVYAATKHDRYEILGLSGTTYLIDKKDKNGTYRYIFSVKNGLIGIGGFTDSNTGLFLVDINCGFGAPKECIVQ